MAIFADYTHTTYSESASETVTSNVTYPEDLDADHPHYDQKGQTIEVTSPLILESHTTITNAYLVIKSYTFYKFIKNDGGEHLFDIQYLVFDSKDNYVLDPENFIYDHDIIGQLHSVGSADDLRKKAYDILKSRINIANSIND